MGRAEEFYYQSLTNKNLRDKQNPMLDAAAAGWSSGISGAMKSKQENDDALKKGMLKGALDQQEKRQEMAAKIIETHNILIDGTLDNSPKAINAGIQALTTGQDTTVDGKTIHFVPKKTERTYQTEGEKMKELITLGQDPATLAKLRQRNTNYPASQESAVTTVDPITKEKVFSKRVMKGNIISKPVPAIPEVPAVVNKTMGIDWLAKDTPAVPAVPAGYEDTFVPAGNGLPEPTVKAIGNVALKAHYKYNATNPKTGALIYSDDKDTWYDESGNLIQ